jgi:hypothetical protein
MKRTKSLTEATLKDKTDEIIKDAEKKLDDPVVTKDPDQIRDLLDRLLVVNKREQRKVQSGKKAKGDYLNALFIGEAGTGKTSRVQAWARDNNINLVTVLASGMDTTDMGGAITPDQKGEIVKRLATTEFDELDEVEGSVLFLDEYNRAPKEVRGSLLTLIQDHTVRDDRVQGKARLLKNFLFTIAAVNPSNNNYNTDELDDAEISRFSTEYIYSDPKNTLNHFLKVYKADIEDAVDDDEKQEAVRKAALSQTLLGNPSFKFDDQQSIEQSKEQGNGLILTARTLMNLMQECDGTKGDFLARWNKHCSSLKKKMAQAILADYEDVNLDDFTDNDDKANDVLKKDSDSEVFKKSKANNMSKLRDKMKGMAQA